MKEKTFLDMYMECVAGDVCGGAEGGDGGATQFSGDTYNSGDGRIAFGFGGWMPVTRFGHPLGASTKKKKKKKSK